MAVGSSYGTVKAAIVDTLAARPGLSEVAVSYAPPAKPLEVRGPTGRGDAIWITDAAGDNDNVVLGAPGLWVDETYDLTVVLQSLPVDSDEDQRVTDRRVDEMLYELLWQTATDPHWGLAGTFVHLRITRGGWRRLVGPLEGTAVFPSRCEFDLAVEARLRFEGD